MEVAALKTAGSADSGAELPCRPHISTVEPACQGHTLNGYPLGSPYKVSFYMLHPLNEVLTAAECFFDCVYSGQQPTTASAEKLSP